MATQIILLALVAMLATAVLAMRRAQSVVVYPWQSALLYRDGTFRRMLPPGRHRIDQVFGKSRVILLSAGDQIVANPTLDVVSADQFAFRIDVGVTARAPDPRAAFEAVGSIAEQPVGWMGLAQVPGLSERIAAAGLAAVGAKPLAECLADPQGLAAAMLDRLAAVEHGVEVAGIVVTKLALPPETRRMLTEVESARLKGLAALERARGEQAALRALANAARLVRDNPELAQLRLLQTVEQTRAATTIVFGATPLPPA